MKEEQIRGDSKACSRKKELRLLHLAHILLANHVFSWFNVLRVFGEENATPLTSALWFTYKSFVFLGSAIRLEVAVTEEKNININIVYLKLQFL